MRKPYTLRGFFRNQDKDTIKILREKVPQIFKKDYDDNIEYADAYIIFLECNKLFNNGNNYFEGDEDWLIDYWSVFCYFITRIDDWCSEEFGWVISDTIDVLRNKGYE